MGSSKATSIVKDPTHPSHRLFQLLPSGRQFWSIRARSARLLNSFFPQAVRALNSNPPTPLWNLIQTYLLKHGPSHPHTLQLYHITENNFFVQFEVCYTQVSGPEQTTCSNTLSCIRTRHFHTLLCVHNPTKRLNSICMFTCSCTTNHLTLFTSQLLDLRCFSLHMYSIHLKHSYSLYFLVYV